MRAGSQDTLGCRASLLLKATLDLVAWANESPLLLKWIRAGFCVSYLFKNIQQYISVGDCGPPDPEFPVNILFSCACSCSEHETGEWFLVGLQLKKPESWGVAI